MSRQKKIKFGEIPLEFTLAHRQEAEDFCDEQTSVFLLLRKNSERISYKFLQTV